VILSFTLVVAMQTAPAPAPADPAATAPSATGLPADGVVVDRIAAVVNKSIVLQSEVYAMLEQLNAAEPIRPGADVDKAMKARQDEVLDSLIAEKLLEEEVRKLRVDVTAAEVDRVVRGTMEDNGLTEEQLKVALQRQGLTLEEYREGLKKQLTKMKIVQLKVKNRVQVDDTQVKGVLAKKKMLDASDYRVKARHILFLVPPGTDGGDAERKARAAMARLEKGEKIEDLAKTLSEDPGSKDRGGDLGEFGRGEMVPEFEAAAFRAEPGKVVGPVKSPFGYHVLLVTERVPVAAKSEGATLEAIRDQLFRNEIENQFRAYLDELKRNAHIEKRI
jgi:peptidyl-prolyl cis-trans isomerase SurA